MSARRAGAVAVAAVVATALLVVLLGAWAATIGPSDVLTGDGFRPAATPSDEATVTEDATSGEPPAVSPPEESTLQPWVRWLGVVVDVALAVLAVYLVVRHLLVPLGRALGRRRRRSARRRAEESFEVLSPPAAVAEAMAADAAAQRQELRDADSPRNAVVACWHRFEAQADAAGVGRHPWETSSEYTMRVLDLVDAHQPAVSRLGALYREARFSRHELTEAHREQALEALDTIHRTIGIPA